MASISARTGYPAFGVRLSDDWQTASKQDADLLLLGELAPDLRDNPDLNVLLQRQRGDTRQVLANRYDPAIPVQRDLMRLWLEDGERWLAPQPLHEDASVPAALACKQPLPAHAADSQAAADVAGLALWCLAERGRQHAQGAAS